MAPRSWKAGRSSVRSRAASVVRSRAWTGSYNGARRGGASTRQRSPENAGPGGGRVKVVSVETLLISLPTRRVHTWAGQRTAIGRDYVLVRVRSDEALEGWGEAPVLKDWGGDHGRYFGESPQTTQVVVREYLAPALEGADPLALEGAYARLQQSVRGYPYAKAAVDVALHDLAGRALGVPVYQLLGGKCRDRVPVAHSIGLMEIADAV